MKTFISLIMSLLKFSIALIGSILLVGGGWCAVLSLTSFFKNNSFEGFSFMLIPLTVAVAGWLILSTVKFKFSLSSDNKNHDTDD